MGKENNMRSVLRNVWENYLSGGVQSLDSYNDHVIRFINGSSVVGITSLLVFGIVQIFWGDRLQGAIELGIAILGIGNTISLRWKRDAELASTVILVLMCAVLVLLLVRGGLSGTGALWWFTFPALIFMKPIKIAHRWLAGLLSILAVIIISQTSGITSTSYPTTYLIQLFFVLIAVTALISFYVNIAQKSERLLMKRNQALAREKQNAERATSILEQQESELANQVRQLEDVRKASVNLLEDIDEEREKLAAANARNDAILEDIGDGLIVTDTEGKIRIANKAFATLTGWDEKEVPGRKLVDILPMYDKNEAIIDASDRPLTKVLATHSSITSRGDLFYTRKDGTRFPVAIVVTPVKVGGELLGAVEVFSDITKEVEIDRAKTEFVSLASHQLRTPLSAINWFVELLIDKSTGHLTVEQQDYAQEIFNANKRMTTLVGALLNVSRLELGTFSVSPESVDITTVIDSMVEELQPMIKKKKLTVKTEYASGIPNLLLDPSLFRIIVQNLLSNAVKYTPENGRVALVATVVDSNLHIEVSDTGYGIPIGQQSKIFTKLFRADNARTKDVEGTGLGLYIVKSILDETGGKVWFTSKENKGSTFFVEIPLSGMEKREGTRKLS